MKEGNRLNEPVIKWTGLNEYLGPVCSISAANKIILTRFVTIKRSESNSVLQLLRWQSA